MLLGCHTKINPLNKSFVCERYKMGIILHKLRYTNSLEEIKKIVDEERVKKSKNEWFIRYER